MFAERACALVKEMHRNQGALPPYNSDLVNEVKKDITQLIQENRNDAQDNERSRTFENLDGVSYIPTIRARHAAVQRNVRCLLAYHYNRIRNLRTMRWEFGSVLPSELKNSLSAAEIQWFSRYSSILAKYMRSIGEGGGMNLSIDLHPPNNLYIEVQCLTDYGRYELSDGSVLLLKMNSRHFLPRVECEDLIRQGVFKHIVL